MPEEALQASQPDANTPAPAAEPEKAKAEEGEIQPKEQAKEGEAPKKDEPPSEAEKIRTSMQKRIDRQTAASKAREERIRQLEDQVRTFEASAPKDDAEPKQDDFDDYDKWQDALVKHRAEKQAKELLKAEKEKELQVAQERRAQEVSREFAAKENTFRASTPDYDRVAGEAVQTLTELGQQGVNIGPLRAIVMEFDNPPEMIYQLGKDTSLIEELVTMSPLKAMRELVKLEAALKGSTEEPKQAPEPIKPVGGKGGAKALHERSGKDLMDWVNKK